ncbi:fructosyl amino acid oxidase, partial [Phakopsora pachyrhizi]
VDKTQPIIIVGGCGTFGLSTAWHLVKRGYTNIICLDRWVFPSRSSAGFDRNKIVRAGYSDPLYAKIAQEAIELWKQPLFDGIFHQTGWIAGTTTPTPLSADTDKLVASNSISAVGEFDRVLKVLNDLRLTGDITHLPDSKSFLEKFHNFFDNSPNFRGYFDKNAGWVDAAKALEAVGIVCQAAGVKFFHGAQGTVKSILRSSKGQSQVIGVMTEDGTAWKADKVILCLGAYSESLIDMEGQVTAVTYSTTHIALTPEEVRKYQNMPVIFIEGLGYTFPPDKTGCIKFCDLHVGHPWKHNVIGRSQAISIPRDSAYHESDTLPEEDIASVRKFIDYCLPYFSNRPFARTAMCWDCEAFDFGWIIGPHPSSPKNLFLATAGSGHTFKNLPNAGKYVVDSLEGKLDPVLQETWRWRPDKVKSVPVIDRVDLAELHGWNNDNPLGKSLKKNKPSAKL